MNIKEFKSQQLNEASTYRVYGREIEYDSDDDQPAQARRGWRPFSPCFCVHDSPNSPCPCMHDIIWWLPQGSIVAKGRADRKDHDGQALQYYELATEANVLVESVHSVSVRDLKQVGDSFPDAAEAISEITGLIYSAKINWKEWGKVGATIFWGIVSSGVYDLLKYAWEQNKNSLLSKICGEFPAPVRPQGCDRAPFPSRDTSGTRTRFWSSLSPCC